jgi:hypothetical protein
MEIQNDEGSFVRLLMWHCRGLAFSDERPSSRPLGIERDLAPPSSGEFADVLAVLVCVEEGDGYATITAAAKSVLALSQQIKRQEIVVVPFGHLSSRLMKPSTEAARVIEELGIRLRARSKSVAVTSFGYHKHFELQLDVLGHPGSVAFREFAED